MRNSLQTGTSNAARGLALFVMLIFTTAASAQVLSGRWVEQSQESIEKHRMADVRVLVLDQAGQPVPGAQVRLRLVRHAFPFGVRVAPAELGDVPWNELPVWRSFSAVSLEAVSDWASVQPEPNVWDFSGVERVLAFSDKAGLSARWGSLVSADIGRLPGWAAALEPDAFARAVEAHAREVASRYGKRVLNLDVYTDTLRHETTTRRMGDGFERWLYQTVNAFSPQANMAVHFTGHFPTEAQAIYRRVIAMREAFVPFDVLAIEIELSGTMLQAPLKRSLDWLAVLDVPIVVTNLRVGGDSDSAAAMNMETVLRTLFAHPSVTGIWLDHITPQHAANPAAALVDAQGEPSLAGDIFESLVSRLWSTDKVVAANDRGVLQARVYAGRYELTATLPNGRVAAGSAWIEAGDDQNQPMIVLQPMLNDDAQP